MYQARKSTREQAHDWFLHRFKSHWLRVLNVKGRTAIYRSNLRESGKRRGEQTEAGKFVREGTRIIRLTRGDGTNCHLGKTRTEA